MPHKLIRRRSGPLAAAALAIGTAASADAEHPFLGNWSGVWDNGQHNEFNVVSVDAKGRITALYCAERPNGSGFYFNIEPEGIGDWSSCFTD